MDIQQIKQLVSTLAVLLTFLAYIPYYKDIIRKRTHPHIYSWTLWGVLTALIVGLQIVGGAGSATYVTAAAGLLCFGVVGLSLKHGKRDITLSDSVVAILSLIAIVFWLGVKQPVISIFLAVAADFLAFVPTVRKSWNKPYSETLSLYTTNAIRFSLVIFAISKYSILSTLWPAAWAIGNALFAAMLSIRRRQIAA